MEWLLRDLVKTWTFRYSHIMKMLEAGSAWMAALGEKAEWVWVAGMATFPFLPRHSWLSNTDSISQIQTQQLFLHPCAVVD